MRDLRQLWSVGSGGSNRSAKVRRRRAGVVAIVAIALALTLLVVLTQGGHGPSLAPSPPAPIGSQAPAGPPALPAPAIEQFGASVNRLFNDRAYTPREIAAQLAALHATGATIARSDTLWEATEVQPPAGGVHHYDWSFDDAIAGSLAANGLRWLPIVDYSAFWDASAPDQSHSSPRSPRDYASFAGALAYRYGPGGTFWRLRPDLPAEPVQTYEIWNEPDNATFWAPAPDASRYAELYASARDAISSVDPTARVIVGGLTAPGSFLPRMVAARPDLRGHVDGVAIHPYRPSPGGVVAALRDARATLASVGLASVPLYVTEFGWTTHPPGALSYLPERLRPGFISATIAALGHSNCGVAAVMLYTWVTPARNLADSEDWFGIHPHDGGTSRDTNAFAAGLRMAHAPGPPLSVCN